MRSREDDGQLATLDVEKLVRGVNLGGQRDSQNSEEAKPK
jgi:hypothetical protein